jgi:NAD(P) transhydrogenase subunit alpha
MMDSLPIMVAVFAVALGVGVVLIRRVPPLLHTPLMSMTNAISGITLVGALYAARQASPDLAHLLGFAAVALATINVVGGYAVTGRMMRMFRSPGRTGPGKETHDG